jgi:hypothetical protein
MPGVSGPLIVEGIPDDTGVRRTDAAELPGSAEKLASGVAVHCGDAGGEAERHQATRDAAAARATKELLAGAPARTLEQQAAAERAAQAALQRTRRGT